MTHEAEDGMVVKQIAPRDDWSGVKIECHADTIVQKLCDGDLIMSLEGAIKLRAMLDKAIAKGREHRAKQEKRKC